MGERADRAAHRFLLVSLWISATVVAGVITWIAVTRLGQEATVSGQTTLTQSEVRRELNRITSSPPATAGGPTRPAPSAPTTTDRDPPAQHQTPRHFRSFTVAGGHVGTSCRGTAIHNEGATPVDGWGMQVKESGPVKVVVEFSRGGSDSKVEVTCSGGVPVAKLDGDDG